MTEYAVVIEKGKRNYGAWVPDLPGCVAVARTRRGVRQLIREAIEFHLDGMRLDGEPVPAPTSSCAMLAVDVAPCRGPARTSPFQRRSPPRRPLRARARRPAAVLPGSRAAGKA